MSPMSDLVKDARLSTRNELEYTIHTFLESTSVEGRRPRRREREEIWERKQHLDIGICGTVWLEECVSNGDSKLRAVKEVRKIAPGSRSMDYSRELEAITRFSQQRFDGCFVKSSGWYENAESVFICMEYLPLGDLQKYMVHPFVEDEAQQIALQLLEGLDFMHSSGFAHQDLKPEHISVLTTGPNWWIKIGDFGINKRVMEGLTGVQTFNSTPAFLAPEVYQRVWGPDKEKQAAPETEFTPEVDIWSLGVITYYMITGKLPFLGQNDLLSYYKREVGLPMEAVDQHQATPKASMFLEKTLAPVPTERISARDALEHPWLIPLLENSEPDDADQGDSIMPAGQRDSFTPATHRESIIPIRHRDSVIPTGDRDSVISAAAVPPLQIQTSRSTSISDVMLPGTIDLSPIPITPPIQTDLSFPVSPERFGISEAYKQILNHAHPAYTAGSDRSGTDSASIAQSQYGGSQSSEPTQRTNHTRHISSINTLSLDSLPPYNRRRSIDAPIPITDLNPNPPSSGASGSSTRNNKSRFSERLRRVSNTLGHKRSGRFQGQGPIHQRRDMALQQEKERQRSFDLPLSPLRYVESYVFTEERASHIVEVPGQAQFGESLPMFPMRTKKEQD
ncbi:hypothetical protein N7492_003830 [Penicillium capsulatum]|uniref:Protein kinase domain-containing protein n=1 Tax=Penicillium capsulatum TaxID=69766 RepID=A0A9W9ILA5_9EURO|nr:hypothetical protein N7492_003830 [Penicillium capsulatum]